ELSMLDLAEAANVTGRTIHRLEIGGAVHVAPKKRHGHVSRDVWNRILEALARRGVELVPEGEDHGSGARWINPRASRRMQGMPWVRVPHARNCQQFTYACRCTRCPPAGLRPPSAQRPPRLLHHFQGRQPNPWTERRWVERQNWPGNV